MKPALVGESIFDVGKIFEKRVRETSDEGSLAGTTVTAISGIELALWDAGGRALNTPICNLFGGKLRHEIRVYADCHAGDEYTPQSYAEKARAVVDKGYAAIKFDLDVPNPHTRDVSGPEYPYRWWYQPYNRTISSRERDFMEALVAATREAVGPDVMLAMDCHWKYNVNDALKLARALEGYDLLWLEDPVPPENVDALAKVSSGTSISICTGENLYRKHGYRELIEKQAADIVSPDVPKMGGLLEAKKVADQADTYYIPIAPHNIASPIGTVAAAHVCAAMSNFLVMEFHAMEVEWWDDLVEGGPVISDGFIRLTEDPGHGLELNEDVARAHLKSGTTFFGES
jgi:L-alanine-DL-glutamate epimerase-like enolase superfamily enzyme